MSKKMETVLDVALGVMIKLFMLAVGVAYLYIMVQRFANYPGSFAGYIQQIRLQTWDLVVCFGMIALYFFSIVYDVDIKLCVPKDLKVIRVVIPDTGVRRSEVFSKLIGENAVSLS